jgi:hypothetical protein
MPAGGEAAFGKWFMMERARPEMGLAGQGNGFAGRPLWPASRKISGIAFENHANLGRAALCEIAPMQFCLMVRLLQQYRCRGGGDRSLPSGPMRQVVNLECINLLR